MHLDSRIGNPLALTIIISSFSKMLSPIMNYTCLQYRKQLNWSKQLQQAISKCQSILASLLSQKRTFGIPGT